ncbi:hypothetical protein PoB_000323700 [Plakobranchus ocellatus]|uniref:Uncharacterized protein n=1 Tax=Plakobranchus ocellatus TaxID=259542 RepID=A0AAV3Y3S9_9GAST|nr:hypothetical protein PoB_000323700 [Plakobranchus ocellatus]
MARPSVVLVVAFSLLYAQWKSVTGMLDLNPSQIQYVADHLTYRKCLHLIETLHEKGFWLKEQWEGSTPSVFMQRADFDRPCVIQLTNWCNGPGRNMTFDFLALRLEEIGLKKVARTLSRKVFHETAEQLHRYFLDDPFEEMIPTRSAMLGKPPLTEKRGVFAPIGHVWEMFLSTLRSKSVCPCRRATYSLDRQMLHPSVSAIKT